MLRLGFYWPKNNVVFICLYFLSLVPPTITFKSKDKVTIIEGNVLYLFCEADSNPAPLVTWRKGSRVLQRGKGKTELIIRDVSENDAGIYECEVSNSIGTKSYTVEVTIKGKVTFKHGEYRTPCFQAMYMIKITFKHRPNALPL